MTPLIAQYFLLYFIFHIGFSEILFSEYREKTTTA